MAEASCVSIAGVGWLPRACCCTIPSVAPAATAPASGAPTAMSTAPTSTSQASTASERRRTALRRPRHSTDFARIVLTLLPGDDPADDPQGRRETAVRPPCRHLLIPARSAGRGRAVPPPGTSGGGRGTYGPTARP